ncbi:ABC transporter ATP-binding protein [Isoptericola sp. F-RaC21]|uniref:ABC transporter ATP-binding protein n=1 Tax=Isoptericola sp. F-RaC21 TaxID=3141452 RepID=UPI00315C28D7
MAEDFVDPLDLRVEARAARRSPRRLLALCRRSTRLVREAAPRSFTASVVLQVAAALLLAGQVWSVKLLLDAILAASDGGASVPSLVWPVALLAALTALTALTGSVQSYLSRYLGERVARSMWRRVLGAATAVPLRSFESSAFYDRLRRVQTNALSRPYQVTRGILTTLGAAVSAVAVGATLVGIAPVLLPLLLLGGVPLLLTSRRESHLEFEFDVAQTPNQRLRAYLTHVLTDRDAAKEIRAFELGEPLGRRMDDAYGTFLHDLGRHLRRRTLLSSAGTLGTALVLAATLGALVVLISRGELGVADAGAAVVAVRMLQGQIQGMFGGVQAVFESGLFLDDVETFLATGAAAGVEAQGFPAPERFDRLDVDDVSFTYPGATTPALDGVSLAMAAGEVVAIVGENGSGKTTLAKVLAGLYEPDEGVVRWDGVDQAGMDRRSLRSRVAVIFQDFVRYALPASENISAGSAHDDARVRAAARATGADRALEGLPQGYATVLSRLFRGGRELSGGQWQRVALARAYYRDAPLVILDEPTSALDPRAEHDLFASLRDVLAGRTAVFISHRFSTVRSADRIVVMDAGRVVESGDHDTLMALGGLYAELFTIQAAAYSEPTA